MPSRGESGTQLETFRSLATAAVLALLCLLASPLSAQDVSPTVAFVEDPETIRRGMGVFRLRCADCHGTDARGVRGPDLTQLWVRGRTDEGIFRTITDGVSGTTMQPIDRVRTRDSEIRDVIAYLRSLAAPPHRELTGDASRGQEIFETTCSVCHQANAIGGRMGPDLSRIGLARSVDSLERRIRGDYGKMRYTIGFQNDRWEEIGERSRDGETWQQFFEMNLDRVP